MEIRADFTSLEWTFLAGACESVAAKERARAALAKDDPKNARDLLRSAQTYERLAERCTRLSGLSSKKNAPDTPAS